MIQLTEHHHGATAEWPRDLLDVDALASTDWRPVPFRQFILKVHGRCNLACQYCYVYRSADQTWRDRPARMSEATMTQTVRRIAEHVRAHGMSRIEVVLHGGEPLLAGPELIGLLATSLRAAVPAGVMVDLYAQTNATLLDQVMLDVLAEHHVRLGISLDGDPLTNDSRRIYLGGRGSSEDVARGLELLRDSRYRSLFAGLLCVIDPQSDPVATYEGLVRHEPPKVDFLLPHANWTTPPEPGPASTSTPFGDWLAAVFDRWSAAPRPETRVRLFEEVMRGLVGLPSRVESVGLSPARLIVVETDGTIEQSDALKSAYEGAAYTGLHVEHDSFDAALALPGVVARQIGVAALAETCQRCDLCTVCGGGFYPHRYRRGSGFRNPSVYCPDLTRFIRHVQSRIEMELAAASSGT